MSKKFFAVIFAVPLLILLRTSLGFAGDDEVSKSCYLKTCELKGDFNGDGFQDDAFLVVNKAGKKGIKIIFGRTDKVIVLGAGTEQGGTVSSKDVSGTPTSMGKGGDDFSWMTDWSVEEKDFRRPGPKGKPHVLRGSALHLEKSATAHVRAYWNGVNSIWDEVGE
jgi:hypothetical protein